jgi:hypothetical protein
MIKRSFDEKQLLRHKNPLFASRNARFPKLVPYNGSEWASIQDALCYSCTHLEPWRVEEFTNELGKRNLQKKIYGDVPYYHISALYQIGYELDKKNDNQVFTRALRRLNT